MSLNHISNKYLHGNFASLKINDKLVGGTIKENIYFSGSLSTQGVNYLNAFSKGSGGSAGVLSKFPTFKNVKITGLFVHKNNPGPIVDVILQKASLVGTNISDLHTFNLIAGTVADQIHTLDINISSTETILVKTQTSGTGTVGDIQVSVIYQEV